jgi:hypothetical protein
LEDQPEAMTLPNPALEPTPPLFEISNIPCYFLTGKKRIVKNLQCTVPASDCRLTRLKRFKRDELLRKIGKKDEPVHEGTSPFRHGDGHE